MLRWKVDNKNTGNHWITTIEPKRSKYWRNDIFPSYATVNWAKFYDMIPFHIYSSTYFRLLKCKAISFFLKQKCAFFHKIRDFFSIHRYKILKSFRRVNQSASIHNKVIKKGREICLTDTTLDKTLTSMSLSWLL